MINNAVLFLAFVFLVVVAGLFSGAETGLYRLSRLRLRLGVEKKRLPFVMLGRCIHDSSGLLLSMLIGTNLSYYIATCIVTRMLLSQCATEHTAEIVTTLITTPILFVFSESIPKNLFLYRSDLLMPYLAPFLYIFHKIMSFCGAIPLLKFISTLFARLAGSAYTSKTVISSTKRHAIQAILQDTHEEGILSPVQTDIINRLVKVSNVRISLVMTPIDKVQTIDINSDRSTLLSILKKSSFTRLPVTEGQPDNVMGFIDIYETLSSSRELPGLRNHIKPVEKLDMNVKVIDAINYMRKVNEKILLVTRAGLGGRQKPLGIVTMKDLVEELLGELAEW
jgi:CBS domain containing-hemolysin-like protein